VNISGDGLDLSGSAITISNCRFENIADKGVSVGENSHPTLVNNLFRECDIGFSTKDLSHAKVAHSTFVGNRLAIEAKRKKPFFGGASAEVINSVFSGNQLLIEEDYFSKDQVSVKHSVADQQVAWDASKTARVKFNQPEQNDYTLHPSSIAGNGYHLTHPDWLQATGLVPVIEIPGIFDGDRYSNFQAKHGTN
ncbi:right-handed parallel beta-helix repeat-containing protein, partial [bacterium]|nr:right-handed parallel beta-helix repeat-containing protein [bacterium]